MLRRSSLLRLMLVVALVGVSTVSAQSDLDALMTRVLARRDENWKKLQQYVLEERETMQVTGAASQPLFGFRREYLWFPQDGLFIKSPISADGVTIGEAERRREEDRWRQREMRRERRRLEGEAAASENRGEIRLGGAGGVDVEFETAMRDALEPGFVSAAYFLNFTFEPGRYALVGRDTFDGREVLRIEYYPTVMFREGRTRPNREIRQRDPDVERKMNKVSQVTMWIDPGQHQIVRYEFTNIDADFLPARWLLRLDGTTATMEMGQPFPDVWLPRSLRITLDMTLAIGRVAGIYTSEFHTYRLASVDTRVRPARPR